MAGKRRLISGPAEPVALYVVDANGDVKPVEVDSVDRALIGITLEHHEVHDGHTYHVSYKSPEGANVADNGTIILVLTANAKQMHLTFQADGAGDVEVELLEEPVISVPGAAHPIYDMNRDGGHGANNTCQLNPTIVGGVLIHHGLAPGGAGAGASGSKSGATARAGTEWILRTGTIYALRATNRSGGAMAMAVAMQWYEV